MRIVLAVPRSEHRRKPGVPSATATSVQCLCVALSRSYSLYQGTRLEAYLSYAWDTASGQAAPPPKKEEVPGTILAGR